MGLVNFAYICLHLPTFTYIYHQNQPNVGKYTIRPMDGMGKASILKNGRGPP